MEDILYCGYQASHSVNADEYGMAVIQTLCEQGHVTTGSKTHPMTYGGLYFLSGEEGYSLAPQDEKSFKCNSIAVSAGFMRDISEMLECPDEIDSIFSAGGYYVPVKNYKTIDERFGRMASAYTSGKSFSKALIVADLLQLINYAVYTQSMKLNS